MARRSQSSSQGDNPLDPNYLPPHYKEYYRMAIDKLAEEGLDSYTGFLADEGFPDFLCDSEVEHITKHLQKPQYAAQEPSGTDPVYTSDLDVDGSSGTYWPMHSDMAAPELDLGWPMNFGFQGTEVTTLIHPPPPDNPSIKEEARRMIRSAQQVVALVMDVFTDVDLFSDMLDVAARRVPVYILLDHMNSHLFMDMAAKCRVNLNYAECLRVRTVSGPTYFCRTGMSFKGQLMEKFLLVDCNVVLSGSYSFMWSFEKIHRSIAHIFQGELVASFDEEFRILFAQSEPLVPLDGALMKMDNPYAMAPYGGARPLYQRKLHMMFPRDDSSMNSLPTYAERVDLDRHYLSAFRRDDMLRHTTESNAMRMDPKKMAMQMEMEQSRAFLRSRQMEVEALKRHSFAEGTYENYSASKQYSRQLFVNNNDEYRFQSSHFQKEQQFYQAERPTRPQGLFEKIRAGRQGFPELDEYGNDPRYPPEPLPVEPNYLQEGFPVRLDYVHSSSSREARLGSDKVDIGADGRLGHRMQRRQNVGQKYICQTSPTQKQSLEQRQFFQDQDLDKKPQENKQGLRNWRISSYMSAYQPDQGDEGLPMPMESEYDDDALVPPDRAVPNSETLAKYAVDDIPTYKTFGAVVPAERTMNPSDTLARYSIDPIPPYRPTGMFNTSALEAEKAREVAVVEKEGEDTSIVKHDSFRSRINPLIQRSSRLRSSLIFSSSKVEQHNSVVGKVQRFQKDESTSEVTNETETGKMSAKVAQILEKYKSISKDPENMSVSQGTAVSRVQEVETQGIHRKSIEAMQYKSMESKVLDSKESFSRTLLDAQYSMSSVNSTFKDLLNNDTHVINMSSKVEKMASQICTTESSKPAVTEMRDHLTSLAEIEEASKQSFLEVKAPPSKLNSALIFGNAMESLSRNPEPLTFGNKQEEDKQEPTAMEFLRRGSLKFKQFLNPKVENKAEEESSSDSAKLEKQNLSYKRLSKGDIQESIAVTDNSEKVQKAGVGSAPPPSPPTPAPTPKSSQSPQSRFPSSSSNVIYSSNLRDDTKVILEQISANSQKNRAEMAKQAQQGNQPNNEDDNPKRSASTNSLESQVEEAPQKEESLSRADSFVSRSRFMRPPQTSTEEKDTILKKMESMRKEKRVYSRFEVFCKKDEQPNNGESEGEADKDRRISKFMPKILGTFKNKK
ncbi:protein FAM83H [Ambystoma mexicanum]|uniref:protein FAM83H n=1 Tax=Ambystoma mexicanum TaxID=8296 RepID=UPI0037E9BE92